MIKTKLIYLFSIMCMSFGYAHDADKAFFNILEKGNNTIIEVELPWSIRNVLIAYDSNYIRAKSKTETRAILFKYAEEKLKLFNVKGERLKLLSVAVDKEEASSHAIKYVLTYEGLNLSDLENTLMLEYYKSQENYHWFIDYLGVKKEVITTNESPSFIIEQKKKDYTYFLVLLVLSVLGILFFLKKKRTKQ